MPELNEIIKSINQQKNTDLLDDYNKSDYPVFVVNKIFSMFPDTIMVSSMINAYQELDPLIQYKYYLYGVKKKNRYEPWKKYIESPNISSIKEYFGISSKKAKELEKYLTSEQLSYMKKELYKGGTAS